MEFTLHKILTSRLEVAYYRMGNPNNPKIIMIHGNVSSSVFYLPLMKRLAGQFDVIACDLRGYGDTEAKPIDATRGMRDWSDDLHSFVVALGLTSFSLLGWSLGGGVVMQYVIDHSEYVEKLMLLSPCSPYGFGGTYSEKGIMVHEDGRGSGGFNQEFVNALLAKDTTEENPNSPRNVMNRTYFKPPFRVAKEWEDLFVEGMLKMQIGEDYYPGNINFSANWPMILPGDKGINNTMSPLYCNLSDLVEVMHKPDVLWFRSDSDMIVSDASFADLANLGKLGLLPGYPGEDVFPIQPMVAQTRYVFDQYAENGGNYKEVLVQNAGHSAHIEQEDIVVSEIEKFMA